MCVKAVLQCAALSKDRVETFKAYFIDDMSLILFMH